MIGVAKVGNRCVSEVPLGKVDVVSVTLHQAPPGTNGQYPALGPRTLPMQGRPVGKEVPLGARRHAPGGHGEAALPVHLGDNEINAGPYHVLKNEIRPLLAVLPHLRGGNHDPHPVGNHHGAVHGLPVQFPGPVR